MLALVNSVCSLGWPLKAIVLWNVVVDPVLSSCYVDTGTNTSLTRNPLTTVRIRTRVIARYFSSPCWYNRGIAWSRKIVVQSRIATRNRNRLKFFATCELFYLKLFIYFLNIQSGVILIIRNGDFITKANNKKWCYKYIGEISQIKKLNNSMEYENNW